MEAYQTLEKEWANFNGLDAKGMVVCASGTAALHLAWECSGIETQHEVICPDLTMVAVPRAVAMAGLVPVFVDCLPNLNIDPGLVQDIANYRTRGLCVVHTYGRRADMDKLIDIANGMDLFVVEDLAEAHGIKPHASTDAACWSFYRNKVVAGEEGGAVWFRDAKLADKARQLRSLGFTDAHDFNHIPRGHNYRMSNLHAQHILTGYGETNRNGLPSYKVNVEMRREIEGQYDAACPKAWQMLARDVPWVYDLRIPGMFPNEQGWIIQQLKEVGIAARHCFKLMSVQPEWRGCRNITRGMGAVRSREVFYLPLDPRNQPDTEQVFRTIMDARQQWGDKG